MEGDGKGERKPDLIPGRKLSAELYEKLNKDISTPPLDPADRDLITIVGELSKRAGVKILVDEPVKSLPPAERTWDFETAPGTTLLHLLEKDLRDKIENLDVIYQFDKILLTTKAAARAASEEQKEEPPAATGPAAEHAPQRAASQEDPEG